MSFDVLGLSPELLRSVAHEGYTEPTPVQREAIPLVLAGRDVLAGAQTGTGKTAAFVLPMLQRLHASRGQGRPVVRALILAPTRELALQVEASVRTYGAQRPIRSTTIYGGVGFDPQVRALRAGPEIVVATPGRLLDHLSQRTIDLSHVEILVLDEADRMLDMGFIRDIRKILAVLPNRRQNLLFSATFSEEIRRLADGFLHEPASVQVSPRNQATELVTQVVHPVDRERKRELLSHLIKSGRIDQALVFTRTKHGANRLATQLEHDGILATAIHGNKSQPQRVRALADFKVGPVRGPRGHRGRGARHRHRRAAARRQLRAADGARGLRPPDRPDRAGRCRRRRRLARVRRRAQAAARHRAGAGPSDPVREDRRLRARSSHSAGADPARRPGRRPTGSRPATDGRPTTEWRSAAPARPRASWAGQRSALVRAPVGGAPAGSRCPARRRTTAGVRGRCVSRTAKRGCPVAGQRDAVRRSAALQRCGAAAARRWRSPVTAPAGAGDREPARRSATAGSSTRSACRATAGRRSRAPQHDAAGQAGATGVLQTATAR